MSPFADTTGERLKGAAWANAERPPQRTSRRGQAVNAPVSACNDNAPILREGAARVSDLISGTGKSPQETSCSINSVHLEISASEKR